MSERNTPRWTCRLVRISGAGTEPRHGRWARRHMATCPECQEYFAAAGTWEAALRADATRARVEPSEGLEGRILGAVRADAAARGRTATPRGQRNAATGTPAARWSWRMPAYAGAVAMAVALVAVVVVQRSRPERERDKGPSAGGSNVTVAGMPIATDARTTTPAMADGSAPASATTVTELVAPVTAALTRDPLQTEAESVYADARSAVQFLALNFLPGATVAQNDRGGRERTERKGG